MSAKCELSTSVVSAIIDAIMRPLRIDESHQSGNDNKERELYRILGGLTAVEALLVRRRLSADRANDELCAAFKRLIVDRRTRLVAYLSDPRRGRV